MASGVLLLDHHHRRSRAPRTKRREAEHHKQSNVICVLKSIFAVVQRTAFGMLMQDSESANSSTQVELGMENIVHTSKNAKRTHKAPCKAHVVPARQLLSYEHGAQR